MPGPLRRIDEGLTCHVINRGNNHHHVFHKPEDFVENWTCHLFSSGRSCEVSFRISEVFVLVNLIAHAALWVGLSLNAGLKAKNIILLGILIGLMGVLAYIPIGSNGRNIFGKKPESLRSPTLYHCFAFAIIPLPLSCQGWVR